MLTIVVTSWHRKHICIREEQNRHAHTHAREEANLHTNTNREKARVYLQVSGERMSQLVRHWHTHRRISTQWERFNG